MNSYFLRNCARLDFFQTILDYSLQATPLCCAQIRILLRIAPILPHNIAHFFAPNPLVVSHSPDLSLRHFFFVCFMSREWCRILVSGLLLHAKIKIDLISIELDTIQYHHVPPLLPAILPLLFNSWFHLLPQQSSYLALTCLPVSSLFAAQSFHHPSCHPLSFKLPSCFCPILPLVVFVACTNNSCHLRKNITKVGKGGVRRRW